MHISLKKQHWELHKLREAIEREVNWKPAKIPALQKVTSMFVSFFIVLWKIIYQ